MEEIYEDANGENVLPEDYDYIDPYAQPKEDEGDGFDYDEDEEYYVLSDEIPETGFTPAEILKAIVTPYGNRRPRAVIGAVSSIIRESLKEPQKEGELLFENALVSVERRHDVVFVGLEFPGEYTDELKKLWKLLREYGENLERYAEIDSASPEFDLFIMPRTNTSISMGGSSPFFWTLQATEPGGKPVQIAMLFKDTDIDFSVNSMKEEEIEKAAVEELDKKREQIEQENKILEEELKKMDEKSRYSMADDFENIVPGEDMVYQNPGTPKNDEDGE